MTDDINFMEESIEDYVKSVEAVLLQIVEAAGGEDKMSTTDRLLFVLATQNIFNVGMLYGIYSAALKR